MSPVKQAWSQAWTIESTFRCGSGYRKCAFAKSNEIEDVKALMTNKHFMSDDMPTQTGSIPLIKGPGDRLGVGTPETEAGAC